MSDNIEVIGQLISKMESRYELLDRGLDEAQASLGYGDFAMVITTSVVGAPFACGRILEPSDIELIRRVDTLLDPKGSAVFGTEQAGSKPGTLEEEMERYHAGFRYGLWYDREHPTGRAMHIHRSRLYPITSEEFDQAAEVGFNIDAVGAQSWFNEVSSRILDLLESRPDAPKRAQCDSCGGNHTVIRTRYAGVMDAYSTIEPDSDRVRLGGVLRDQVDKILSRHVYCEQCETQGPNLMDQPVVFVDVQQDGLAIIETVFDYGPELPLPDWE